MGRSSAISFGGGHSLPGQHEKKVRSRKLAHERPCWGQGKGVVAATHGDGEVGKGGEGGGEGGGRGGGGYCARGGGGWDEGRVGGWRGCRRPPESPPTADVCVPCSPQAKGVDTETTFIDPMGRPIPIGNGQPSEMSSKTTFDFAGPDNAPPPARAREGVRCEPGQRQRHTVDLVRQRCLPLPIPPPHFHPPCSQLYPPPALTPPPHLPPPTSPSSSHSPHSHPHPHPPHPSPHTPAPSPHPPPSPCRAPAFPHPAAHVRLRRATAVRATRAATRCPQRWSGPPRRASTRGPSRRSASRPTSSGGYRSDRT